MSSLILKRAKVIQTNSANDNIIVNGNFDIWQRGSSFTSTSYIADRWHFTSYGSNQAQRINSNIGLDNTNNCIRLTTLSSDSYGKLTQVIPTEFVAPVRNQTVTLSFYARPPASGDNNWTGPICSEVYFSPNIDNITDNKILIVDSVLSGVVDTGNYNWRFYSKSFSIPSNASTLALILQPSGYLNTNAKIDIAKIKLEPGTIATPLLLDKYDHELYSCKRFYQQVQTTMKAGAAGSSVAKKGFGLTTPLSVKPRISNPIIKQQSNTSISLESISANITNDNYLNVTALANSSYSELSTQFIIDGELAVGRPAAAINFVNIIRETGILKLDWNTPLYADENISDYVVLYGNNPNSLNSIATFPDTTGNLTGLSDSAPYYIKIKSVSPFGESPLSNTFESAPLYTIPSGVGSLTGAWGFDRSYITWTVPENNGGSPITGYRIDRSMYSTFSTGPYTSTHIVPILPTSFDIAKFSSELSTTGDYYFRVCAMNLAGTGALTTLKLPKTTGSEPTNISTSVGISQTVVLNYSPPTGNGGATISQFQLQYSTGNTFTTATTSSYVANYQPITISNLTNNITYYFRGRFLNSKGWGPYSQTVSNIPFRTPTIPGAPTALSASWIDDDTVNFTWIAPTDNGGVPIINYTIYSSTGSSFPSNLLNPINTTNAVTSISFDVPITGSYSTFYFRNKANNSVGSSSYSSTVSLAKAVPAAPNLYAASPGNGAITASWIAPISRGSAITGYTLNYSTSLSFTSSTSISVTGLSYTISGLSNDTLHYIRVLARNSVGAGSYSNILSATPKDPASPPGVPTMTLSKLETLNPPTAQDIPNNTNNLSGINYQGINFIIRVPITIPYSGGNIYGTNPYSWDSDIRTAAIHAGALSASQTGIVYLYQFGGLNYYNSGIQNGITSLYRGPSSTLRSYKIVGTSNSCTGLWTPNLGVSRAYGNYGITHNWNPPTNNGGTPITGYEIQSSTSSTFSPSVTTFSEPGNATVTSNCLSASGNRIYSRIRAANSGGYSSWSIMSTIYNVTNPSPPISTVSALSTTGIRVVWTGVTTEVGRGYDNVENIAYKFLVYNSGTSTLLYNRNFTNSSFPATEDIAIAPGKYYCTMQTINSASSSAALSANYVFVPSPTTNTGPTSWIFTASPGCCDGVFTNSTNSNLSYPSVSALKDTSSSTTFSTCNPDLSIGSPYYNTRYIMADFGSVKYVRYVYLRGHPTWLAASYLLPHALEYSNDGITWTTRGAIANLPWNTAINSFSTSYFILNQSCRYIRILSTTTCIDLSDFYFS